MPKKRANKKTARPAKKKTVRNKAAPKPQGHSEAQAAAGREAMEHFSGRTPQPVLEALFPAGAKIGSKNVIPLTISSYTLLERLGNPITEPNGLEKVDNIQLLELCYILTHPLADIINKAEELDAYSKDRELWENMLLIYGADLPLETLQQIGHVVGAVIMQATQTMVATQPKKKEKG